MGAPTCTRLCPLSALESGTGSSRSLPGVAAVPQTWQAPHLPRQPKPLPANLIPARVHKLRIQQAQDRSLSQSRATPSSQATPPTSQPGPGGSSRGAPRAPIPMGLREVTMKLTPKTSRPHGQAPTTRLTQLTFPPLPLTKRSSQFGPTKGLSLGAHVLPCRCSPACPVGPDVKGPGTRA